MREIDIVEPFCSSKKTWLIWSWTHLRIISIHMQQHVTIDLQHTHSASTRQQSSNAFTRSQCGRGSRVTHNELITFCVISIPLISNASAETEAAGSLCRLRHDDTSGDSGVYCKCSRCGNWHNELALSDYTFNNWDDIVGNGLKAKLLHDNDNISLSTAVQLLVLDW